MILAVISWLSLLALSVAIFGRPAAVVIGYVYAVTFAIGGALLLRWLLRRPRVERVELPRARIVR